MPITKIWQNPRLSLEWTILPNIIGTYSKTKQSRRLLREENISDVTRSQPHYNWVQLPVKIEVLELCLNTNNTKISDSNKPRFGQDFGWQPILYKS